MENLLESQLNTNWTILNQINVSFIFIHLVHVVSVSVWRLLKCILSFFLFLFPSIYIYIEREREREKEKEKERESERKRDGEGEEYKQKHSHRNVDK